MLDDLKGNSAIIEQCMARAIYDNIADAPDELPFRKGDILTVLEQNSGGLEGWWLCSLKGMQGICPGNRLRVVTGRSKLETHSQSHEQLSSTHLGTKKVVTPKRVGDVYLYGASRTSLNSCHQNYDIPPQRSMVAPPSENYDSPRPIQTQYDNPRPLYDTPKSSQTLNVNEDEQKLFTSPSESCSIDLECEEYDVPRPQTEVHKPDRTSKLSFMSADSHFTSLPPPCPRATGTSLPSLAFSTCSLSLYDVPPEPKQVSQPAKPSLPPRGRNSPLCRNSGGDLRNKSFDVMYDIPPQVSREPPSSPLRRISTELDSSGVDLNGIGSHELPLELNSAKDTLAKLEQETYCSLERFIGAKPIESELKSTLLVFNNSLNSMLNFARGSIGNALKEGNDTLSKKICQLMHPLEAVQSVVCTNQWSQADVEPLALNLQMQINGITPALKEDIHHLSNTIQAHSHLIFKRSPIISAPVTKNSDDIVRLRKHSSTAQTKYANTESHSNQTSVDCTISPGMCDVSQLYENELPAGISNLVSLPPVTRLDSGDKQVLNFYSTQAKLHLLRMNASIDSFLLTIENNQPPKVFIAHSKLVILAAHRLVYIGDAAHKNVSDQRVRKAVLNCSNSLCDAMRSTVLVTKTAAMQFPSVSAVQDMVDSFVSISHLASNLKSAICGE